MQLNMRLRLRLQDEIKHARNAKKEDGVRDQEPTSDFGAVFHFYEFRPHIHRLPLQLTRDAPRLARRQMVLLRYTALLNSIRSTCNRIGQPVQKGVHHKRAHDKDPEQQSEPELRR